MPQPNSLPNSSSSRRVSPRSGAPRPSTLLITGATGMVGSYVMAELLRRGETGGRKVAVIARGKGRGKARLSAAERIDAILTKFESYWGQSLPRPTVMQGDLLEKNLGLSPADLRYVRGACHEVLHSAASLSFSPASESPENEPYRTNVDGTKNLIEFCEKVGIESLHHISTAYVCGIRSGRVLESESNVGQEFANDYERSKTMAEAMVEDAFGSRSLTAYRPSIVIDRTGLAPVSGDRTIYGAYSMYQMLASRFGLPEDGVWFRNLGFAGNERKNLIDVDWISRAIATIINAPEHHGVTHHLTTHEGTSIETLDSAFRKATEKWLQQRRVGGGRVGGKRSAGGRQTVYRPKKNSGSTLPPPDAQQEIDQMAAPFVRTFLPYFRDDPTFDRTNIDRVIATTDLDPTPSIGCDELLAMIGNWSAPISGKRPKATSVARPTTVAAGEGDPNGDPNDIVICGYAVRLPGGVEDARDFEALLFEGRSAITQMPANRLDRSLYFDSRRGIPGKTYTEFGGCVDPLPTNAGVENEISQCGDFDLTHRQFAQVAVSAFRSTFEVDQLDQIAGIDTQRAGVFVGHSGGTQSGGPLAMATMAESAASLIDQTDVGSNLPPSTKRQIIDEVTASVRSTRPVRQRNGGPNLNAYSAASLTAQLTGMKGRREVIDAACSSSLIALQHAALAITQDRMDVALVGGATFNNVDNLALFSQSGACSDSDSHPFDSRASGLISSEGYVAMVLVRRKVAQENQLPILATLQGVGTASDGKGKGLWAPRTEGQQLAMKRGAKNGDKPLSVDYLECHATSTQVGDATELESLTTLLGDSLGGQKLPIGSVKSNLGHLLEAAGLVGMVKCLIAMKRGEVPPTINFAQPTSLYDWTESPVQVVDKTRPWPESDSRPRVAGVNAFGIGGLNAHAVISQKAIPRKNTDAQKSKPKFQPIAIVGRGVVLPGADSLEALNRLLQSGESQISDPPKDRWLADPTDPSRLIGIGRGPFHVPHARGGYVKDFKFDAQSYRIPPKLVRNANPAQLMLIEAVRQAIDEFDSHQWTVDRQRVGVSVGTIFGGEFSNELQVGLRLPELEQHLRRSAQATGVEASEIDSMIDQYHKAVLNRYPALLDETGGFTASTLASAIARIFNLMGGAYAVDADEASGGLAILSAVERLNAGDIDVAICGSTHRAMDLVALEQLYRKNQLVGSGLVSDSPKDGSEIFPGEGVASILLQRHEDAVAQGREIFGVITSVGDGWTDQVSQSRGQSQSHSIASDRFSAYDLSCQLGHLGGAQGMVRTIAATLAADAATSIRETAMDGYEIEYQISSHASRSSSDPLIASITSSESATPAPSDAARVNVDPSDAGAVGACLRIETASRSDLAEALEQIVRSGSGASHPAITQHFRGNDENNESSHQVGIVGASEDEIRQTADAILTGPFAESKTMALPRALGWIRFPGSGVRTAWLFPGQGSQYPEIPSLLKNDAGAQAFLNQFDSHLGEMGLAGVSDRLHDPERVLGRDVWWTQLWVLAVGTTMADAMLRRGHRPDVVLGHSFGECTAAWCAGVMTTEQAIQFAKYRSDAVVTGAQSSGELLSVRSAPTAIKAALQSEDIDYTITHHNAPQQTVIAGSPESIARAKATLTKAGLASIVIPVPAPFHTPAMEPAQRLLSARFENQSVGFPKFGFLSAISNRYLAEPQDVIANLIEQLTRPVCFAPAIERLVEDGCGLMIEVGPNDVLTRLAGATTVGRVLCFSADDLNRDHDLQNQLIDLAVEAISGSVKTSRSSGATIAPRISTQDTPARSTKGSEVSGLQTPIREVAEFSVVDVTKRKRSGATRANHPVTGKGTPTRNGAVPKQRSTSAPLSAPPLGRVASASAVSLPEVSAPVVSAPVVSVLASVASTPPAMPGGLRASAKSFLFDLVVDLTGYDPEIIEFDADLEGELGVDSIKKAQLIGEIVQWGDLDVDLQSMRLAQFGSLDDILELVEDEPATLSNDSNSVSSDETAFNHADVSQSLQRMIIDLVVDQTGYDEDIIDMDADLEGELGVDSIKRAQLLGELETTYDLQSLRDQNLRLSDFPTLASIHAYVFDHLESQADEKKKHAPLADTPDPTSLSLVAPISRFGASHGSRRLTAITGASAPTAKRNDALQMEAFGSAPSRGTHRFVMRMRSAPRLDGMPVSPTFHGPSLVIGSNPIAQSIIARLQESGFPVHHISTNESTDDLEGGLDKIWQDGVSHHLFITTPCDKDAHWDTSDAPAWEKRQTQALALPYRVCQRWMQRVIDDEQMDQASLVSVVNGGGDFGFSPNETAAEERHSAETGGIAGLTKAMLIEAWMRGYRDTPMLVIDALEGATPHEVVEGLWRELAVPSYEEEVAVAGAARHATCARYAPLETADQDSAEDSKNPITRGGTWIVAGGGRGITAMTAMALAQRHDLKLHLLGMAETQSIDDATRDHARSDRAGLRRQTMARVQREGENPVKHWRKYEKAIEIDQTLAECKRRGISAAYHSVDVSDAEAVQRLLTTIRKSDGPIHGVIQGAGSGQDARFDRKRADKVQQCLSAKIDGCAALAAATADDPLEFFIGFGSISGRFGANGHTDYSAANDMLAKMIGGLSLERPHTRCFTFHWHAWGDVGMATKPEAKLALDMIGMEFMPATEGLQHFLNEIENGGDETEVLITDRRYVRKFFPTDGMETTDTGGSIAAPMLDPSEKGFRDASDESGAFKVTLDPTSDLFLKEHLVQGRPTLPFVMAIEMLGEAASVAAAKKGHPSHVVACRHVRAIRPLKCLTEDAFAIEIIPGADTANGSQNPAVSVHSLVSDLRRRDGRLVEAAREHFTGEFELAQLELAQLETEKLTDVQCGDAVEVSFVPIEYLSSDAPVYHGPTLQCLRQIGFSEGDHPMAIGTIVAPSPAHLAGESRPLAGWVLSPATMDAVLYAAGMLAYRVGGRPSLPIEFDEIKLGRLPQPGEPLRVVVRWESDTETGGVMSATLAGLNRDLILSLDGYHVGWLG